MFKIKFIKNPPTVENLKSLYESEMYQNLLKKFDKRAKHNLATREWDTTVFYSILTRYQRRYLILNIPFDEVLSEFEKSQNNFLDYLIASIDFFNEKEDENPDGEFPKGEEPEEDDKSVTLEVIGMDRTFFIDKFCEFYLLKTDDKERLLHYLKTIRMPYATKYAGQITKLYKQLKLK